MNKLPLTIAEFDAIENARMESAIREILGPHGAVATYHYEGEEETSGWTVFDGAVRILRIDVPVGSILEEEPTIAEARDSILRTIADAFVAGRASVGRPA